MGSESSKWKALCALEYNSAFQDSFQCKKKLWWKWIWTATMPLKPKLCPWLALEIKS